MLEQGEVSEYMVSGEGCSGRQGEETIAEEDDKPKNLAGPGLWLSKLNAQPVPMQQGISVMRLQGVKKVPIVTEAPYLRQAEGCQTTPSILVQDDDMKTPSRKCPMREEAL